MILGCADDRLKGMETKKWIASTFNLKGNIIVFYWPGSVYDFINAPPEMPDLPQFMINKRLLPFFVKRKIVRFIVWQHELCVIYEDNLGIISPKKMYRKQIRDMEALKIVIEEVSPDTETNMLYGNSKGAKRKKFSLHEIK